MGIDVALNHQYKPAQFNNKHDLSLKFLYIILNYDQIFISKGQVFILTGFDAEQGNKAFNLNV